MARKAASPYIRTTEVGGFVNASWKEYWYRSIEKQLFEGMAAELVTLSRGAQTAEFWQDYLSQRTALKEADRISYESTTFGKSVHAIVESFLLNQPTPTELKVESFHRNETHIITDRERFSAGLIVDWCRQAQVKPLVVEGKPAIEFALQSEEMLITGHPDLICTFGESKTPWIVDWKTSKECRDEYGLQLAAYALAFKEQTGISIDDGVIVRTPSDPNATPQFETHEFHNLLSYHGEVFKHALNVVQYFKHKGKHQKVKKAA